VGNGKHLFMDKWISGVGNGHCDVVRWALGLFFPYSMVATGTMTFLHSKGYFFNLYVVMAWVRLLF